jgi:hypothetical protein
VPGKALARVDEKSHAHSVGNASVSLLLLDRRDEQLTAAAEGVISRVEFVGYDHRALFST